METVLVTGASSGIGRELARLFAADGARLVLVARREDRLQELANELQAKNSTECIVVPVDLSAPDGPDYLYGRLVEQGVEVHVLVNNAGLGGIGWFASMPEDRVSQMVQVNVAALTRLTRLLLPGMMKRGQGGVLNLSSTASFQPGPYMAVYYATKAYARMFSVALAHELRHHQITVTCLCPGPTLTEFGEHAGVGDTNLFRTAMPVERVARAGYEGFRRGKKIVIPGVINRLASVAAWLFPQWIVIRVASRLHRSAPES